MEKKQTVKRQNMAKHPHFYYMICRVIYVKFCFLPLFKNSLKKKKRNTSMRNAIHRVKTGIVRAK